MNNYDKAVFYEIASGVIFFSNPMKCATCQREIFSALGSECVDCVHKRQWVAQKAWVEAEKIHRARNEKIHRQIDKARAM